MGGLDQLQTVSGGKIKAIAKVNDGGNNRWQVVLRTF